LIPPDHAARVIWELSGNFDLSLFEATKKTKVAEAGRPCWPARLLVSMWIYSYTLGMASARAIADAVKHEPGLRWLTSDQEINHHTLSDFRVGHQEGLESLFAQFLVMLEKAGVVDFGTMLHDGTKIKAVAGKSSLHRHKTLKKSLKEARRVLRSLERRAEKAEAAGEALDKRREAAQHRAAREAVRRAEAALQKMQKMEAATAPAKHADLRVSDSEPEAQKMKHADGSWAPSYNVQVSTEPKLRIITAIGVTTAANDLHELVPAIEQVKQNTGAAPQQVIADNGYATRENVEQTSAENIELIAPWKEDASREAGACARNGIAKEFGPSQFQRTRGGESLICPAGKGLVKIGEKIKHGVIRRIYQADGADCKVCMYRKQCCPVKGVRRVERVVESRSMRKYLARMKKPAVKKLYEKRSEVAEFPHLWAKAVKQWRRFSVRGTVKAGMEAMWVALAYNFTQWQRVRLMSVAA